MFIIDYINCYDEHQLFVPDDSSNKKNICMNHDDMAYLNNSFARRSPPQYYSADCWSDVNDKSRILECFWRYSNIKSLILQDLVMFCIYCHSF